MIIILNDKNFTLFAAKNYVNPRVLDVEEFNEDVMRFKYLVRLLNKYKNKGELQERLILNHLTIIHNVFSIEAANEMCFFKVKEPLWPALKTFLLFLNVIKEDDYSTIPIDPYVVKKLQSL